jgi:hypothetical protein
VDEPGLDFGARALICTFFPIPGKQIWLSPLPNSTGIHAEAINDLGDVVGGCDNGSGFFYSASTKAMTGIDSCYLNDINMNRQAVGFDSGFKPIMVDLSQPNPALQPIAVPADSKYAMATAVNSSNTIVGFWESSEPATFPPQWGNAFVYSNGSMFNLNDLLRYPSSYYLIDAMDINDLGPIVGTALLSPHGYYAYVATPHQLWVPKPPITWPPIPVWPPWSNPWPIGWWPPGWGNTWPYPVGGNLPQEIAAELREQASRMPTTGRRPSARQLEKMLDAHRARRLRGLARRRKRPSRRRASQRRRE